MAKAQTTNHGAHAPSIEKETMAINVKSPGAANSQASKKTLATPSVTPEAASGKTDIERLDEAVKANPPEWVNKMPCETFYQLVAFDGRGITHQEMGLTRDEYADLKDHLAEIRGHLPAEDSPATPNLPPKRESFSLTIEAKNQTELEYLQTCLQIRNNNHGSFTPFEDFFNNLFIDYKTGRTDLEIVSGDFDEFKENLELMAHAVKTIRAKNPNFLRDLSEEPATTEAA